MKLKKLKRLERQMVYCSLCSNCSATCCSFKALGWESYTPRARVMLAKYQLEGVFTDVDAFADRMYNCSMCANCTETCPAPMDPREIIQSARMELWNDSKAPHDVITVNESIKKTGNPFGFNQGMRDKWVTQSPRSVEDRAKTLLFQGCIPAFQKGEYLHKLASLYKRMEMPLSIIPSNMEVCCGLPALDSGNVDLFNELMNKNIDSILALKPDRIVFACPSCYSLVKEHYGRENKLFNEIPLVFYTDDLIKGVENGKLKLSPISTCEGGELVTYHDPCHLGRFSRLWDSPREIIKAVPNAQYIELMNSKAGTACCGSGGEWLVVNPPAVAEVADKRLIEVLERGAGYLINTCFTCQDTLQGASFRVAEDLEVVHLLDLFED